MGMRYLRVIALGLTAVLAACSDGSTSLPTDVLHGDRVGAVKREGTVHLRIEVPPRATARHRGPKYVSAATQSMAMEIYSGNNLVVAQNANLTATTNGCGANALGGTLCNFAFNL